MPSANTFHDVERPEEHQFRDIRAVGTRNLRCELLVLSDAQGMGAVSAPLR